MSDVEYKSNGDGTCRLVINKNFSEEILHVSAKSPGGDKVISLYSKSGNVKKIFLPCTMERVYNSYESSAKNCF